MTLTVYDQSPILCKSTFIQTHGAMPKLNMHSFAGVKRRLKDDPEWSVSSIDLIGFYPNPHLIERCIHIELLVG
jgi:hypothetical protein